MFATPTILLWLQQDRKDYKSCARRLRWYITRHNCAQLFRRIFKCAKETIYGGSYIDQIPATLNGISPSRDPSSVAGGD